MRVPSLGPGLTFRYSPHLPASRPTNFDTPEYANIVASGLQHHGRALAGGMRPLPRRSRALLRAWISRLLTGAWTHAGYLNWDTGHGRLRWHSGQYWAFAQQGLLAIAASPELQARRAYGRWAKALFDRGLGLYERWAVEAGGVLAPQLPFGVWSAHRDQDLYAARIAANAARAVVLGLGRMPAEDPPPLFAFDRDSGRLAVTTPRYSTAILPRSNGAFEYGGIELARLFGAGQVVAANTGGRPPAAFGVVAGGLASQDGSGGRLRVLRSHPRGPFRVLDAIGTVRRGRIRITTRHRFRHGSIEEEWTVRCRCAAEIHLPSPAGTSIGLVRRDGSRAPVTPGATLDDVARIELGGYSAAPVRVPPGARLFIDRHAPAAHRARPGADAGDPAAARRDGDDRLAPGAALAMARRHAGEEGQRAVGEVHARPAPRLDHGHRHAEPFDPLREVAVERARGLVRQRRHEHLVEAPAADRLGDDGERLRAAVERRDRPPGGAPQHRQRAVERPVGPVAAARVGDQQHELARSRDRARPHGVEQVGRRRGPVGDDEHPRARLLGGGHRAAPATARRPRAARSEKRIRGRAGRANARRSSASRTRSATIRLAMVRSFCGYMLRLLGVRCRDERNAPRRLARAADPLGLALHTSRDGEQRAWRDGPAVGRSRIRRACERPGGLMSRGIALLAAVPLATLAAGTAAGGPCAQRKTPLRAGLREVPLRGFEPRFPP